MAIDYLLSRDLKESSAYDLLDALLEQRDFYSLKNLYCGKTSYTDYVQGEVIEYESNFPESRDMYAKIKTYDNVEVECKIYNHNNNIRVRRRNYSYNPIKEDDHIFAFDYKTGRSTASCIYRDVFINNDNEYHKVTRYSKATFEWDGTLCDYEEDVKTFNNNKTRKY